MTPAPSGTTEESLNHQGEITMRRRYRIILDGPIVVSFAVVTLLLLVAAAHRGL